MRWSSAVSVALALVTFGCSDDGGSSSTSGGEATSSSTDASTSAGSGGAAVTAAATTGSGDTSSSSSNASSAGSGGAAASGLAPDGANPGEQPGIDGDNAVVASDLEDAVFRVDSKPGEHVHFFLEFGGDPTGLEMSVERYEDGSIRELHESCVC